MAGDEDDFADTVDVAHKQKHGGEDDQEDDQAQAVGSEDHQAWRFLLAGGVAGAGEWSIDPRHVSRPCLCIGLLYIISLSLV